MQEIKETWVQSLGQEDPLEEHMATNSNILAWRIPWTEKPGWVQSISSQRVRHDKHLSAHACMYLSGKRTEARAKIICQETRE